MTASKGPYTIIKVKFLTKCSHKESLAIAGQVAGKEIGVVLVNNNYNPFNYYLYCKSEIIGVIKLCMAKNRHFTAPYWYGILTH